MARTKQTARKSTGGKAPRSMAAAPDAGAFRAWMTAQQAAAPPTAGAGAAPKKASFLNYSSVFSAFGFDLRPLETKELFAPKYQLARSRDPLSGVEDTWLGVALSSKLDGPGIREHGRPPLDLVLTLDVSGSMAARFDDDDAEDHTVHSKIDTAKRAMASLLGQLRDGDRVGLVVFNHSARTAAPLTPWSAAGCEALRAQVSAFNASGGTNLGQGMNEAVRVMRQARPAAPPVPAAGDTPRARRLSRRSAAAEVAAERTEPAERRLQRIVFFTDLQSSCGTADEDALLRSVENSAAADIFCTVVGVGMDFNLALVERISRTRGSRYMSISSSAEFDRLMVEEFDYDVTPVAFNVRCVFQSSVFALARGFGSPDVEQDLGDGSAFTLSSEFPSVVDGEGQTKGGLLLFRLRPTDSLLPGQIGSAEIVMDHTDPNGVRHSDKQTVKILAEPLDAYSTETPAPTLALAMRKAVALVRFVDLQAQYVLDDSRDDGGVESHTRYVQTFSDFRAHLLSELRACGDTTLGPADDSSNFAFLQIIDKIIDLEIKAVEAAQAAAEAPAVKPDEKQEGKRDAEIAGLVQAASANKRRRVTAGRS